MKGVAGDVIGIITLLVAVAVVALLVKNGSGTATAAQGFGRSIAGTFQAAEGNTVTAFA